jgi:HAD superfamily hydrolase (TIGR01509 family)
MLEMNELKLNVKGILFDLDGTILDTKPAYVEAGLIAFKFTGQEPPKVEVLLQLPKRIEQKQTISDIVKTDPQEFLSIYLETFYRIAKTKTKSMPGVAETLQTLSKKAKLAVITMRFMPKQLIFEELEQYGLAKYFAHIVTALDTHQPKPSPEALIKAVEALDVQMCECVIVGDSVSDVKAGKAVSIRTVALLSGLYSFDELAVTEPDLLLNDVSELPKYIE